MRPVLSIRLEGGRLEFGRLEFGPLEFGRDRPPAATRPSKAIVEAPFEISHSPPQAGFPKESQWIQSTVSQTRLAGTAWRVDRFAGIAQ